MNIDTITREEQYLNRLTGETDQAIPEPETRKEQYLSRLCGADNIIPQNPITREEQFFASLCGEEVEMPEPETRLEQFMAFAGSQRENKPEPITRKEQLWDNYQGGAVPEEKTVSGTLIHVTDAIEEPATKLAVTMTPSQEATPFVGETTTEPYLSKTASTTGNKRYLDKIVGGTVCWNQLIQNGDFSDGTTNWASRQSGGLAVVNGEAEVTIKVASTNNQIYQSAPIRNGHKYLATCDAYASANNEGTVYLNLYVANFQTAVGGGTANRKLTTSKAHYAYAIEATADGDNFRFRANGTPTVDDKFYVDNINLTDLTQLFANAPAIADYVYSLEQATKGAGVQWLKDHGFIDDLYRAYNPGELISAKPTAFTVGSNTYTLGGVDLRGLFKLDAQNNLYCEGDELTPDGQISERYKIIDLGSYDWSFGESTSSWYTPLNDAVGYYSTNGITQICSKYVSYPPNTSWGDADKFCAFGSANKNFCIKDLSLVGYTPEQIKTYLTGTMLIYKLETHTTSSSTPYTNPAPILNGDTEAFTDTRAVPIPCGNESHYAGEYEIEGHESVTVYQAQTQDEPNPTEYEVEFTEQGTVYGGVIDIVTGVLTITWGYIASYNGETLTGRWMSSLDVYAEGTTPTTGAEVAYELASPITAELTPQEVQMLLGENTLWTQEAHELTLTYKARAAQRVLAMNRKLNLNKQALEIKRNSGVIIDKPIIKPIDKGGLKL